MKRRNRKVLMKRATREYIEMAKEKVREKRKIGDEYSELHALKCGGICCTLLAGNKNERLFSESEIKEILYAGLEEEDRDGNSEHIHSNE